MTKYIISVGFVLCASTVTAGSHYSQSDAERSQPPRETPLVIEVDSPHLRMHAIDEGVFQSNPFRLSAGSVLPRWRVSMIPGPIDGPASDSPALTPKVTLVPDRDLGDPGRPFQGTGIELDDRITIASGGPTGGRVRDINTFSLVVECDPLSRPGDYNGSMRLVPEVPGRIEPLHEIVLDYEWNVVELLAIRVRGEQLLDFGVAGPGIIESENFVIVEVFSNHLESTVRVEMPELVSASGEYSIPGTTTCIGYGTDSSSARQAAQNSSFGTNEQFIATGPGYSVFWICGRINLTHGIPASSYSGYMVLTAQVTNW